MPINRSLSGDLFVPLQATVTNQAIIGAGCATRNGCPFCPVGVSPSETDWSDRIDINSVGDSQNWRPPWVCRIQPIYLGGLALQDNRLSGIHLDG